MNSPDMEEIDAFGNCSEFELLNVLEGVVREQRM